jgi:hypothetical protein
LVGEMAIREAARISPEIEKKIKIAKLLWD